MTIVEPAGGDPVRRFTPFLGDIANSARRAIDEAAEAGDLDTSDMFTEISRGMDKHLWFLETHLQSD